MVGYKRVNSSQDTVVGYTRVSSSEDIWTDIQKALNRCVTLNLNPVKQSFHKTFCRVMLYHQRKFGSKRISISKDIIETDIIRFSEP